MQSIQNSFPIVRKKRTALERSRSITPAQLRAARSLLDWSRDTLAVASGISSETIKNIEHEAFTPHAATLESLFETFAGQGVDFLNLPALNMVGVVLALSNEQKLKSQKAYK